MGRQKEAGRVEEGPACSDKRVQGEEDSKEKVDEGAKEAKEEAESVQLNKVR